MSLIHKLGQIDLNMLLSTLDIRADVTSAPEMSEFEMLVVMRSIVHWGAPAYSGRWNFKSRDLSVFHISPVVVKIQMPPTCVGGVVVARSPRMSDVRGSNLVTATGYALLMSSNKSETRVQCFLLVWTHRNNYARTGGRPFKREWCKYEQNTYPAKPQMQPNHSYAHRVPRASHPSRFYIVETERRSAVEELNVFASTGTFKSERYARPHIGVIGLKFCIVKTTISVLIADWSNDKIQIEAAMLSSELRFVEAHADVRNKNAQLHRDALILIESINLTVPGWLFSEIRPKLSSSNYSPRIFAARKHDHYDKEVSSVIVSSTEHYTHAVATIPRRPKTGFLFLGMQHLDAVLNFTSAVCSS
ncbi:hypothetical protein CLF_108949 [Clonorchis sinensis]|uniref:Uncharacterized protein n=1 Tax=Clonorchis sinensis TaxID=79923 RepID=G7YS38_CLOSI|nr:hypothetical protein CLF_108949 [Clonorchis sinensis]